MELNKEVICLVMWYRESTETEFEAAKWEIKEET